ncbi:hypothetical protein SISSUDRAFT_1014938 [Sistotremastrum suecicum HHB10207 ss-3]|uniref:Thioredoxin-like fold domain-containing protein n=1 Tax=Sistotremastrum suecicum HHB10207 ss-3 TaxID=1314776 RepID=A0A166HPD6_9AGAM|nr:hypothetical protein SISSUDRAFT_1014938 [Sistotremastrum suecicum HHB10207 ss-3]
MALQPSLRSLIIAGPIDAPHTLDFFVDYICPYSAKLAKAIETSVKPLIAPKGKYGGKVKVIFRNQVQPWHGSSTFVHEAGLAVARVSPENFWPFSLKLFEVQQEYFDIPASKLTAVQIREKLAKLSAIVLTEEQAAKVNDLLLLKSTPNGGTAVTEELKYTIKYSRQNGIHVSPTVLWDGLVAGDVSSSWGTEEWEKFFEQKVTV